MKKIFYLLSITFLMLQSCSTTEDNSSKDTVPLSPTELTANLTTITQATLNWTDNSTNETGFKIERKLKDGSSEYSLIGTVGGDITSYVDNDLLESTAYYYRVLAYNKVGNSSTYTNQVGITTSATITVPILETTKITSISYTTANTGGNITSDGGGAITARGVVWSTSQNPTILLSTKTLDGTGIGSFTSSIGELKPGTVYFMRAYATNSAGTSYGRELGLSTPAFTVPTLTTLSIESIKSDNAKGGGDITSDGGSAVTARGVVWSSYITNPTISLSTKTVDGIDTGTFSSSLIGLKPGTTHYVCAYATNSTGTSYGNVIVFTTQPPAVNLPSVTICDQIWMSANLDVNHYRNGDIIPQVTDPKQWANLTTGAWCYYANNTANGLVYGKMYNWYAVNDPRGLAPQGWHIPSNTEWGVMTDCLGGTAIAGGKMKESGTTHWSSPNTGATNSSGFTAIPGGQRNYFGNFETLQVGSWWSSDGSGTYGFHRSVLYDATNVINSGLGKETGLYVRCVKD